MDDDDETGKFKLMAGFVVAFLISMVTSCQELKFTIWGKTATADVVKMEEVMVRVGRGGIREEPRMQILFTYDDAGTTVKKTENFKVDFDFTDVIATKKLPVQYLPGDKFSARLPGTGNVIGVVVFFSLLGVIVLYFLKCVRDAKKPM